MVHAGGFEPSNLSLIRRMLDPLKLCVHLVTLSADTGLGVLKDLTNRVWYGRQGLNL